MANKPYYTFSQFNNLYLEDSFVLNIKAETNYVEFLLEVVLTENHPLYLPPCNQEQYCYKKAKLRFFNATEITWIEKTNVFFTDANNEIDYGNIDEFFKEENYFYLSGDWGKLRIVEPLISLEILTAINSA